MSADVYTRLREQLDHYSVGFPETESGVELKILKKLFREDQAELFLKLTLLLEDPAAIALRTGGDPATVSVLLAEMADQGLIFRLTRGEQVKDAAVPFVVGSWEFQVKNMDRELAELFEQFHQEAFARNFDRITSFMRPIPVGRSVDTSLPVGTHEDARRILAGQRLIAVANCICRVQQGLLESDCGKPLEVCFSFGSHAEYYVENGMARVIALEEALKILEECEAAGLVTQPYNTVNPGGMCQCCGDCCGVLRGIKKQPRPVERVLSNFFAAVDGEACVGCATCVDRCQMEAIDLNEAGTARIDLDRCIGCGLCVTTCPTGALSLKVKPEEARRLPPQNGFEQMQEMAQVRGKSLIPLALTPKNG